MTPNHVSLFAVSVYDFTAAEFDPSEHMDVAPVIGWLPVVDDDDGFDPVCLQSGGRAYRLEHNEAYRLVGVFHGPLDMKAVTEQAHVDWLGWRVKHKP